MKAADPRSSIVAFLAFAPAMRAAFLQRGDRKLPVRLTEGDKSHSGGHQIGDIALQKGRQGEPTGMPSLAERTPSTTARAGGT